MRELMYLSVRLVWQLVEGVLARPLVLRQERQEQGLCEECGYDLRTKPERCPECGHWVTPTSKAFLEGRWPSERVS
jgi:hypothetical protein